MGEEGVPESDSRLGEEAVDLLGRLLRLDTSNPPGNERPAQQLIAELLSEAGFECELMGERPTRPNLVARLRGEAEGPRLALLGHTDTVPADASEWSFDPWAGDVAEGEVRGRGALDMKGQVAAEVAACVALGREGWRPRQGELLLIATVDEEAGTLGARWLCEQRPDAVRCELALNEGGGMALERAGHRIYPIAVGEKGVFRFRLRSHGRAGHGSMPRIGDNALLKLAPHLAKLERQPPLEPSPEPLALLKAFGERPDGGANAGSEELAAAVERVRASDPAVAGYLLEPMLGVTLTPTGCRASEKANVIPSVAEALVDCRVPPERDEAHAREAIRAVLGEDGFEIEFTDRTVGNRSQPETPLWEEIADWIDGVDPGGTVVPTFMPGFSDSHWFRATFGTVAYGFWPRRAKPFADAEPLIHGADERIACSDVALGARFFCDIPRRVLG